jgi:hypothetical protein
MNLVKIGSRYLNIDRVTEVRDTGREVEVFFESKEATVFRGSEAERIRRWLDRESVDLEDANSPPTPKS